MQMMLTELCTGATFQELQDAWNNGKKILGT